MPPRSSLTSSFSVSDANNEVVCPLTNNDGSNCRKRCLGEKRYRSMQEHIRRAHPNYYIPKLPATEESFQLMVNTPPDQRPHQQPPAPTSHPRRGPSDRDIFARDQNSPATPRTLEEAHPAAATAAVALAQLQHHRLMSEWDSEVIQRSMGGRSSINERKALSAEPSDGSLGTGKAMGDLIEAATSATEVDDDRDIAPVRPHSPPFRSLAERHFSSFGPEASLHPLPPAFQSTPGLPPAQSSYPRQFAPLSYTASPLQKALTPPPYEHSGPPDTDLEPFPSVESSLDSNSSVSGKNYHMSASGLPPPMSDSSPVQPPRPGTSSYPLSSHPHQLQPHIRNRIHHRLSNPTPFSSHNGKDVQIYCASCSRPWPLRECLACTECICGVCRECVSMMSGTIGASPASILNPTSNPGNGISGNGNISAPRTGLPGRRGCPSCGTISGKWKSFQLDFR
ncbi:hypothetical protein CISG_03228 [Coccidioides immitis RMSCC 3703]|uniref:RING zinc finger-like domain-containing protein n=1 Tax=Coccidioides immitis RMSCC 3703 TaxID=454286 RepID=A0A0J8QK46_COCIT|nr:hypothetical protein CISG_03228 [Coccidioides immitis RMSCC 3703]